MSHPAHRTSLFEGLCIWFSGLASGVCRAGIAYHRVRDVVGQETLYPCIAEDHGSIACLRCHYPTKPEAEARAAGVSPDELMRRRREAAAREVRA